MFQSLPFASEADRLLRLTWILFNGCKLTVIERCGTVLSVLRNTPLLISFTSCLVFFAELVHCSSEITILQFLNMFALFFPAYIVTNIGMIFLYDDVK